MKDEANRGAQSMHRNRRPLALLSLVSLMAALALAWVQNVELMGRGEARTDGIAQLGIEGEGDIPLPIAEAA
jgi:hypothetical protein